MSGDVSVIVPAYNGASYVREAVASVCEQSLLPVEIIVVDDCSSDATLQIVDGLIPDAPVPLRVIALTENSGGPARPINVGVAAARGEFIAILDQDDVYLPDTLAQHTAALAAHPSAGFSFSYGGYMDRPGEAFQPEPILADIHSLRATTAETFLLAGDRVLCLFLRYGNFVRGFPGFAFRRSMWEQCGPVPESRSISGDFEFLCAMSNVASVACVPAIGYLRREHADNMCRDEIAMHEEVLDVILQWLHQRPDYLEEADVCASVRSRVIRFTRMCRAAHQYRRALRICERVCRLIGWDRSTRIEFAKVIILGAAYTTATDRIARDVWSGRARWRHQATAQ